jgi:hypothetical protein
MYIFLVIDQKTALKFALMKNQIRNSHTVTNKKCCILFSILCIALNVFGEIKNGYKTELFSMQESLKNLTRIISEKKDLLPSARRSIESKIQLLISNISYYELTEKLLSQFKIIAPDLYSEIDTIKDNKGRAVDVFVKFIPTDATKVKAWGTTYMRQVDNDQDCYISEYGVFTVSVKIWIVNNALGVLAHELGHVKYQVPHLAHYFEYHKKNYFGIMNDVNDIGHNTNDPSGKSADQYEKLFRREYAYFLKGNEKIENPIALVEKIRKKLSNNKMIL